MKLFALLSTLLLANAAPMPRITEPTSETVLFHHIGETVHAVSFAHLTLDVDYTAIELQLDLAERALINVANELVPEEETARAYERREWTPNPDQVKSLLNTIQLSITDGKERIQILSKQEPPEQQMTPYPSRKKRFLGVLAAGAGIIGSLFLGAYNTYQITELKKDLGRAKEERKHIIQELLDTETTLNKYGERMMKVTSAVENLYKWKAAQYSYDREMIRIMEIETMVNYLLGKVAQLEGTVTALAAHKVYPALLQGGKLKEVYAKVERQANDKGYTLMTRGPYDLLQLDASFLFTKNGIHVFIHVPMTLDKDVMDLYRYIPVPFRVADNLYMNVHTEQDVIAVSQDGELFKAMKHSDLTDCTHKGTTYLCARQNVMHTKAGVDSRESDPVLCAWNLFHQNYDKIKTTCKTQLSGPRDMVVQISANEFLVLTVKPKQGKMRCTGRRDQPFSVNTVTKVKVPEGCTADVGQQIFAAANQIEADKIALIYGWPGNPQELLEDLPITEASRFVSQLKNITFPPMDTDKFRQWRDKVNDRRLFASHVSDGGLIGLMIIAVLGMGTIGIMAYCIFKKKTNDGGKQTTFTNNVTVPTAPLPCYPYQR
jgi:hypothetical protein